MAQAHATCSATIAELSGTPDLLPKVEPPQPWNDWDEVRRTREDLWLYRTLFLHRAENLTPRNSTSWPVYWPAQLVLSYGWRAPSWSSGLRSGQTTWATDGPRKKRSGGTRSGIRTPKRRRLRRCVANNSTWTPITSCGFSAFLHNPAWESTNNAAECGGRALRHGQHPHFRLRLAETIDADLKVRAYLNKERFCSPPPARLHYCQRGRRQIRDPE